MRGGPGQERAHQLLGEINLLTQMFAEIEFTHRARSSLEGLHGDLQMHIH